MVDQGLVDQPIGDGTLHRVIAEVQVHFLNGTIRPRTRAAPGVLEVGAAGRARISSYGLADQRLGVC
jgi:hypothetical protein